MTSATNLTRAIADVVSLDGWVEEGEQGLQIHADVVFRTASVGGNKGDAVRFRLSLFRAELVSIIRSTEGLKLKPSSIARDRVKRTIAISNSSESGRTSSRGFQGGLGLSPVNLIARLRGTYHNDRTRTNITTLSESTELDNIAVQHRKGSDGNHRWELVSADGKILNGSGWDSSKAPRFEIEKPLASQLDRCILFQVRCLREDMCFKDITLIPNKGAPVELSGPSNRNKLAAAEAYIKTKLVEHGLLAGDLDNPFAEICLLETIVEV